MKLGAVPNLSSLSYHCYWKGCGAKGLVGSGLGLVGKSSAIIYLGGVSALLGLLSVYYLVLRPPRLPPRHWQERNRKGRAKISMVVVGWLDWQDYIHCLDNCPGRPE